ncbi:hypothetical protein HG15A2_43000 [Adhaeretor mobilis]|uniref:Uncharacterized protein n=1 Tax=Adhaeretor mobilis TaxID=1930276 RepID=A0A517N1S6_9BACT|nr:hypothetical protein HG15A2_43000 [Adhaeretor mobilis]
MGEVAQRWHAPKKYADAETSGLEFEVDSARDDVKIELDWEVKKNVCREILLVSLPSQRIEERRTAESR